MPSDNEKGIAFPEKGNKNHQKEHKDKKHGIDYIRFPTSIRSYNGCKVFVERADLLLLIFHYAQPTFTPA